MQRIILGLIGEMGAGKTTVTTYLQQHHNARTFRFSDALRDILNRLHLEQTREHLQHVSTALRSTFGDDVLSKVIAADVNNEQAPLIVVEGIRRPGDIAYLRNLNHFYLVALQADERARFDRLSARSENPDDRGKTWETFQKDSHQESEQKIRELLARAQYTVDNNGTVEETYARVEQILEEIHKI